MKLRLRELILITRQSTEVLNFSESVTFLYGPVGTGKSTVARLIDYCFGGELERTPAIQQEFISCILQVDLGDHACTLERAATDTQAVRASWGNNGVVFESRTAPLDASENPLVGDDVYNLSDLLFYLCGVVPIKVRKRSRDPDSPMVRLSFRDIWWYCYLEQAHLDSSFFRLDDPFRGRKSQDAMRFFTGLHSERLSQLETMLYQSIETQQGKREAVRQIREFMRKFDLGSEGNISEEITQIETKLGLADARRQQLEADRSVAVHPTDRLRAHLRTLGVQIADTQMAILETEAAIAEQRALRAELITTKIKADRTEQAGLLLSGIEYSRCPQCGVEISRPPTVRDECRLCGSSSEQSRMTPSLELEAMRREMNDRIDQIADSIDRRDRALGRSRRKLSQLKMEKISLDSRLQSQLARYDSAFVESIRSVDREIATLMERRLSMIRLQELPRAINELEMEAGALQGEIDNLRSAIIEERARLQNADKNVAAIAGKFKAIMLAVGFPGVDEADEVILDTRRWRPVVVHRGQEWSFWDAGSGGKKTLFNVCYALAVHSAARECGMPVPNLLIIDSPTKNISDDENPELVAGLYREIFRLASLDATQLLLIDSDLVVSPDQSLGLLVRYLAGTLDGPSLIRYYHGP